MNLDLAAVMGIPYSGCEICDQVVVMGASSAQEITFAWETHRRGEVHRNGGVRVPDKEVDMTPEESFYEDRPRNPTPADISEGYAALYMGWITQADAAGLSPRTGSAPPVLPALVDGT